MLLNTVTTCGWWDIGLVISLFLLYQFCFTIFTSKVLITLDKELMPSFSDTIIVNWRFSASFSTGEMTSPFCCVVNTSSSSLMEPPRLFLSCFSNSMLATVSNLASSIRLLRLHDPPCWKYKHTQHNHFNTVWCINY